MNISKEAFSYIYLQSDPDTLTITTKIWKWSNKMKSKTGSKLRWSRLNDFNHWQCSIKNSRGWMFSSRMRPLARPLDRQIHRFQNHLSLIQMKLLLGNTGKNLDLTIAALSHLVGSDSSKRMERLTVESVEGFFATNIPCTR